MEKPLVSVVTITRNRGKLIGRCIQSVLEQTYKNVEHIVVDGASDDNTDEVVGSFKDERLHFVKLETNWPIKETIDHGISLCKGKYITFLDSDDEYLSEKIEKQVNLIERLPEDYGFVYCWMTYYDNKTKEVLETHKCDLRGDVCDEVIADSTLSGTPTLMFRSEVIRKIGGWKSVEEIGIASDWEMCARACQITKVDYVPESLVNVYINHGSVRQSEGTYYAQYQERSIKYHKHFLKEFASNFKRKPKLAFNHYWGILASSFILKKYGQALLYMFKALSSDPKVFCKKIVNYKRHEH